MEGVLLIERTSLVVGSGDTTIVEERLFFVGMERAEGTGVDMWLMSSPVLTFLQSITG